MKNVKRNVLKILTGGILMGSALTAFGQVSCNGSTACQGPAKDVFRSVFAAESGGGAIILINSPAAVQQLPCTGANGGENVRLSDSNAAFKETYATILTAVASEANVVLRVTNASSQNGTACELQFVQMLTN